MNVRAPTFGRRRAFRRLRTPALAIFAIWMLSAAPAGARWNAIRNARLAEERYYDGDSFELFTARSRRVYRLYFVDAPETDRSFPDRVKEQADYFRVSVERALELGEEARAVVREFTKEGVIVHHRREDAGGRSDRYFALIEGREGAWLCEALVEAGLARLYGKGTDLPDGTAEARHWARLRAAERRAREARVGGWADRVVRADRFRPAPPAVAPRRTRVRRMTTVLNTDGRTPRVLGLLAAGADVEILGAETAVLMRIRFRTPAGPREGLVAGEDLEAEGR